MRLTRSCHTCERRIALLLIGLWCVCLSSSGLDFVTQPQVGLATTRCTRSLMQMRATDADLQEIMYPPDKMFKISADGKRLTEEYPGARDPASAFWTIVQPTVAFGFLVISASSFFEASIVEWNPITATLLPFLKYQPGSIEFVPQGLFMGFYGFFGTFIFGPLQWYLTAANPGQGVAEFNKDTQLITIVRDNEVDEVVSFSEVKTVKMVWNENAFGTRDIVLKRKDGDDFYFSNPDADYPRRILERRAVMLGEFMGKEVDIDEG